MQTTRVDIVSNSERLNNRETLNFGLMHPEYLSESDSSPPLKEFTMCKMNVVAAAILVTVLSACSATPDSRATGQVIDDSAITARVKTEIAKGQGLTQAASINVDTYRGVVMLAGFVDSKQQMDTAVAAATAVTGVEKVINNLRLKSAP